MAKRADKKALGDLAGVAKEDDQQLDVSVRPKTFADYVGQDGIISNLRVFVAAAKLRGTALDHLLFCGPPGLGKTTLAIVIAQELGVDLVTTSGPAISRKGDLAGILTNLKERDVFFIDEMHRLPSIVEENLYPAMEDYHFDYMIGEGPSARNLRLALPKFTLIGATTRSALLSSPMRDRFGYVASLEFYPPVDLACIVRRSSRILNVSLDEDAALEIACRSRGTPRIANRLLRRLRDFADVWGYTNITQKVARDALVQLGIDSVGLDRMDYRILKTLRDQFHGGPVGIESIAACLLEERETLEDVYEPYLLQEGFLQRTARGRLITDKALKHLNGYDSLSLKGVK